MRASKRVLGWSNPAVRAVVWQVVVLGVVGALVYLLVRNTMLNLERRHVTTGFAFLGRVTGVPLASPLLEYDPSSSTYGRAFLIGIINTLRVWVVSAFFATLVGTFMGLAKLSPNWLLRTTANVYVGAVRNVPCLLQILFWVALIEHLGAPDEASRVMPGVFLSNRGLALPWVDVLAGWGWTALAFGAGLAVFLAARFVLRRREQSIAVPWQASVASGLVCMLVVPLAVFLLTGSPAQFDVPQPGVFEFTGGLQVSGEFAALAVGLSVYGSGYIAEVVRAGVQAVPKGQWEAAASINLATRSTLRWVILPQALRVIIPPMTSQYLSLLKNSSLAIVIGYQDIVAVANLSLTQTGQAVEAIIIIMLVYLVISAPLSLLMNWYNARLISGKTL